MEPTFNLLVAGAPGVGKTCLGFTLARNIYPCLENIPRRFEGWTISVNTEEADTGVTGGLVDRRIQREPQNSSNFKEAPLPPSVGLLLWEDWPRTVKDPKELMLFIKNGGGENPENPTSENEEQGPNNKNDQEQKHQFNSGEQNGKTSSPHLQHGSSPSPLRVNTSLANSNNNWNSNYSTRSNLHRSHRGPKNKEEPITPVPVCIPERPCLNPVPELIVLCFSAVDLDSFVEAETKIYPELRRRYPEVPILLVATKCDLRGNQGNSDEAPSKSPSNNSEEGTEGGEPKSEVKRKFEVTSDMGRAMRNRILAGAFIECSALEGRGLRPILFEAVRLIYLVDSKKKGLRKETTTTSFFGASTKKKPASTSSMKQPFLLGASGSSKKHGSSSSPGSPALALRAKHKSNGGGSHSHNRAAQVLSRSKAVSFNFIRGSMSNLYKASHSNNGGSSHGGQQGSHRGGGTGGSSEKRPDTTK